MTVFTATDKKGKSRMVGETVGSEFRKKVHSSKHFLKIPPAIAIEKTVWDSLQGEGIKIIRIKDLDKNQYWNVLYETFSNKKMLIERGGFDKQYALPIEWWEVCTSLGTVIQTAKNEQEI